ncbi:MAG TPA: ATP-binding cassette domain-containing protein [Rugosimonospora sp.]|jgi:ABC-type glutathione transport system ATPase component
MPPEALLQLDGIQAGYGSAGYGSASYGFRRRAAQPVVRDVDLSVAPGEIRAVVGESGSGKSTLARVIVGLLAPDHGTVRFDGADLPFRRSRAQRRAIQMVFQDPRSSLNPRMSVASIIDEAWRTHPSTRPADTALGLTGLLDSVGLDAAVAGRRVGELSGGQAQRVSIARAVAVGPRLLVCDEAVSALDVSVQTQILALLLRLREDLDLSILFITHDLGVVRQIADRVSVMHEGRIVEQARTDEVFEHPRDPYTKTLLGAVLDLAVAQQPASARPTPEPQP